MKMNLEQMLTGYKTERRQMSYTWRDVALYALSVGAKAEDLQYLYEKDMKVIPTFGVVPYWGTINVEPRLPHPEPAAQKANDYLKSKIAPLHMEHELLMYRPIDPMQGTFLFQDKVTDVFDRGEGKGVVIKTQNDIHDIAGNLVCSNISSTIFPEGGGFGGKPMPKSRIVIPDRQPDFTVDDYIGKLQNVLYRLTGDTNLVHIDPEYARAHGYDRVLMQGLCSFGFACRMAIEILIPGQPERMTRIAAQMRSILYMDTPVSLQLWQMDGKKAYFRFINKENGQAVLDRGVFEWR